MEFHQILVSASPGDAITNTAFEIRALLRRIGPSEIFARHIDAGMEDEITALYRYAARESARSADNILIFHASIGDRDVMSFVRDRPERLILIYHNISPARYFWKYDPEFAAFLEAGRRELALLRQRVALALAASSFNARELGVFGFRDVRVSPLIVDLEGMLSAEPDPATTHHLETKVQGPSILFVGQMLPHKRPDLLLEAHHALVTYLVPDANLFMVGAHRVPRYSAALRRFVQELNLPGARMMGAVSRAELVAYYRRADAFVTLSEHEGFCIPLVEAMAFNLPVVARDYAAIPSTLDGAGLLLPPEDDPLLAAEAIAAVILNEELRDHLVARGRRRLMHFDVDAARSTLLQHLLSVV